MEVQESKYADALKQLIAKLDAYIGDFKPCKERLPQNEESLSNLKERLSEQLKMIVKDYQSELSD